MAEQPGSRDRRWRLGLVVGAAAVVLVVIAGIVIAGATAKSPRQQGTSSGASTKSVVAQVASVSPSIDDAVGVGLLRYAPQAVKNPPALTLDGKPLVVYVGAEFCPYCAAERWAMVQALSRFGTFGNLVTAHSSAHDSYPNTATFTFRGSTYTSATVAFRPTENEDVDGNPLEKVPSADAALWHEFTGSGGYPFLDIGGRYVITGPSYDPGVLRGLTAQQIAAQLDNPRSDVARAVVGTANMLTAAICKSTGGQPGNVCSSAGVQQAAKAALRG